jgi:polar amino acid transport system substrate-binding protein
MKTAPHLLEIPTAILTIGLWMNLLLCIHPAVAQEAAPAAIFPNFRHVDAGLAGPPPVERPTVRLLADGDFPPFSFVDASGKMTGISVDLALAVCARQHLTCEVAPRPFASLLPALLAKEGDVIITGMRLDAATLDRASMTRPYFRSGGRFLVKKRSALTKPDVPTLAGRRVGVVKGTRHEVFLNDYFSRSAVQGFASEAELLEALKTDKIDTAFSDSLHMAYWLNGEASGGCCQVLGGTFMDPATISTSLSFLTRKEDQALRLNFDYALDRLQEAGDTAGIFGRYLPSAIW